MLPISFDPDILSSLPTVGAGGAARVTAALKAIVERRVIPYLASVEEADPVRLARVAERLEIARLEDPTAEVTLVSVLGERRTGWTVFLHERIFDYIAFGLPTESDAGDRLERMPAEGRRVLALAELVLRHEVEHAVFPHRSEPDLVDSDLRFLRYRRDGDRSFFEAVQDVLRDPTNGLRGEAWLGLLDVDEDGQDRVGLVRDMVDGHVARMTELPASVLVETARTLDEDTTCRLIQAGVRRAADPELPLRRRATMIERVRRVLADLGERDLDTLRGVIDRLDSDGDAARLRAELEVAEVGDEASRRDALVAAIRRSPVVETPAEAPPPTASSMRWRQPGTDEDELEPRLDGPELMGEPPQRTLDQRVQAARADPKVPRSVLKAIDRNSNNLSGQSKAKYTEFVETLLAVPWGEIRPIDVGPREFAAGLNSSHFGLERPKELVADFFSNLIWRYRDFEPESAHEWSRTGSAFLFVGPPGVGKTSLAISIAQNLGIPFHKVSLGGMRDESDLRGHGFTYEGSKPGAIVQGLIKMGVMNGMFILDEADKTESFAIATLLEILDPEQNHLFHDRYTQTTVDVDLSNCHFVLTANTLETVPAPVIDRCQVVTLDRYAVEEKVAIARRHLIPRIRRQHRIDESVVDFEEGFEDEHLRYLIRNYTHEAGVRQLALVLRTLFLRLHRRDVLETGVQQVVITRALIKRRLEEPRRPRSVHPDDRVGEILGLGVDAERGIGEVIPIQATRIPGAAVGGPSDDASAVSMVHATGNLEKVMDESRRVATTGILHCAEELGVDPRAIRTPVHLHFLGASTRKDGPSAGCAIALALTSLLTGQRVRRDVAVTGEIDTQGRVTGVGGVDIKLETAVEAGCTTLIIPRENLDGPGGVNRFPEPLKRELQILDFDAWIAEHPPFDPQRHVIQVVAVDHVVQAAEVALIRDDEIDAIVRRLADEGRRQARSRLQAGECGPRCPMVVLVKDADELNPDTRQPALCGECSGCRLVVPAALADEAAAHVEQLPAQATPIVWDPERSDLGRVLTSVDVIASRAEGRETAVVAPFFALREAGPALSQSEPDLRLMANNYTRQGVKLKGIRSILDAVYCRLLHLGGDAMEASSFLSERDGITVLDLSVLPEKYRLDDVRAEAILVRGLEAWLASVDEVLTARRAS
jgi:ATP-dependent Lon protease